MSLWRVNFKEGNNTAYDQAKKEYLSVLIFNTIILELIKQIPNSMDKTIQLRVRKEIDNRSELKVLKLKGILISRGFTQIIHIADQDEHFYLNSFSTSPDCKEKAEEFVLDYIGSHDLGDTITVLSGVK